MGGWIRSTGIRGVGSGNGAGAQGGGGAAAHRGGTSPGGGPRQRGAAPGEGTCQGGAAGESPEEWARRQRQARRDKACRVCYTREIEALRATVPAAHDWAVGSGGALVGSWHAEAEPAGHQKGRKKRKGTNSNLK